MNRLSGRALGVEEALHKRDRVGVQDFVLLENFQSEEAFVENLEKRFNEDIIYVSAEPRNYTGWMLGLNMSYNCYFFNRTREKKSLQFRQITAFYA